MNAVRLTALMSSLTNKTVPGELISPVSNALDHVRKNTAGARVLSMPDFIALGVLRHLQGTHALREQIQSLSHLEQEVKSKLPLAHSTWSDALSSTKRCDVLTSLLPSLLKEARSVSPGRLARFEALNDRPVHAMDGTCQAESAHCGRCTPRQGGEGNPKGHALLSFYDVRLGCPADASVETRNRHEVSILRDHDELDPDLTQHKNALWLADRGFIDATFWDRKKKLKSVTMITRMKKSLCITSAEDLPLAKNPVNEGVIRDQKIVLQSSPEDWCLITFRTRRGRKIQFPTNDFTLEPGLTAFLHARRWDEEKCFDTWKNDFSQAKAWGASKTASKNQVLLAIVTNIPLEMLRQRKMGQNGVHDEKALRKQERRQTSQTDGTDRPDWSTKIYQYTSKISKQVLRFFKLCLHELATQALYDTQLRPVLLAYL